MDYNDGHARTMPPHHELTHTHSEKPIPDPHKLPVPHEDAGVVVARTVIHHDHDVPHHTEDPHGISSILDGHYESFAQKQPAAAPNTKAGPAQQAPDASKVHHVAAPASVKTDSPKKMKEPIAPTHVESPVSKKPVVHKIDTHIYEAPLIHQHSYGLYDDTGYPHHYAEK